MTDEEIVPPDRIYACGLRSSAWVYLHSTLFLAIVEVWITRAETGRRADTSYLRAGGRGTKKCHPLAGGPLLKSQEPAKSRRRRSYAWNYP
jgi:hypothetical protein